MGAYEDLTLPEAGDPSRPFVAVNMVSSVNGVASVGGGASGIGGAADRESMRELRSRVDAVMVGAGTLRAEKMTLGLDHPSRPQPLAVVVCGPEPPPLAARLIRSPSQPVLLAIPEEASDAYAGYPSDDTRLMPAPSVSEGRVDLGAVVRGLRADHGVARVLAEGGPSINGALFAAGLVDELFVTVAPSLLAGSGAQIVRVDEGASHGLRLISAIPVGGEVFLRYAAKWADTGADTVQNSNFRELPLCEVRSIFDRK